MALAVLALGLLLLALNLSNTVAAFEFLGPSGKSDRSAYVSARRTQVSLADARSQGEKEGKKPFDALVQAIATDTSLKDRTISLTDDGLADNSWLTPQQSAASPLIGIGGIILSAIAFGWLLCRAMVRQTRTPVEPDGGDVAHDD